MGRPGAAWACACAARMDQEEAFPRRLAVSRGRILSTCVSARTRLAVPARGRVKPGTRAHRDWGRAGRKWSEGAGEVEDEPASGTEREGGADRGARRR